MKKVVREVKKKVDKLQKRVDQAKQNEWLELKILAQTISSAIGPKRGFALFLFFEGNEPVYLSNAVRSDVVLTMKEWLSLVPSDATFSADGQYRPLGRDPDPFQGYERINLEKLCVKIAENLETLHKICLFLFDFGDGGNMAFRTNIPQARSMIQGWVDGQS